VAAVTHLGSAVSSAQASSYATGTFAPAVGDLLVVFVAITDSLATVPAMAESAGGGTYGLIGVPALWQVSAGRLLAFVRNSLCETNTTRTFTFTTTDAGTGCVVSIAKVTGMTRVGQSAIRQSDPTDNGASGVAPNTVFPGVALTGNACIGSVANLLNPAGLTPPTSFTELLDTGGTLPTNGFEYASRDSGHTSATITWGNAPASAWGAFSIELDATVALPPPKKRRDVPIVRKLPNDGMFYGR
jgi:hypothetical protein